MSKTVPTPTPRPSYNPLTRKTIPQDHVGRPETPYLGDGKVSAPAVPRIPLPGTSNVDAPARAAVTADEGIIGNVNDPDFREKLERARQSPKPVVAAPVAEGEKIIGNVNDPDFLEKARAAGIPGHRGIIGEGLTQAKELVKGVPEGVVNMGALALKGAAANQKAAQNNAAQFGADQLKIMDRIDAGETLENSLDDAMGYAYMDPEQRKEARAQLVQAQKDFSPGTVKDSALYRAGAATDKFGKELLPAEKGYEDSVGRTLGTGLGSVVGGAGVSMLPGGQVTAPVLFGLGGQGEAVDNAIKKGASNEDVITAGTLGLVPGMTDSLPIETLLDRIPGPAAKIVRGMAPGLRKSFLEAVSRVGWQATVEGVQEGGQQFLQNAIAKGVYNPKQDLGEGVAGNAAAGAGVGGLVESLATPFRKRGGSSSPAPAEAAPVAEEPQVDPAAVVPPVAPVDPAAAVPSPAPATAAAPVDPAAPPAAAAAPAPAPITPAGPSEDVDLDTTVADLEQKAAAGPTVRAYRPGTATLKAAGYDDGDIADMDDAEFASEIALAQDQGIDVADPAQPAEAAPIVEEMLAPVETGDGSRQAPAIVDFDTAAARVAEPTPAQAAAGNYRKAHLKWQGLDISIETPKGGTRRSPPDAAQPWEVPNFPAHYGYLKGVKGADGDQLDLYMGDHPDSDTVYMVNQVDADTGAFDEVKPIAGAFDEADAARIYEGAFSDGRAGDRTGSVTPISVAEFKDWVANGDTTQPYKPSSRIDSSPFSPEEEAAFLQDRADTEAQQDALDTAMNDEMTRDVLADTEAADFREDVNSGTVIDGTATRAPKASPAREPGLLKRPVIDMLKRAGGVAPSSPLASELAAMGVTPRNAPGLFRINGRSSADNFVAEEFPIFDGIETDGNGYIPEGAILEAIGNELAGNPLRTPEEHDRETDDANRAEVERAVRDVMLDFEFPDPRGTVERRAVRMVLKGMSPDDAVERAIMTQPELKPNERDRISQASGIPFFDEGGDVTAEGGLPWGDDAEAVEDGVARGAAAEGGEPGSSGSAGSGTEAVRGGGANEGSPSEELGADDKPQLVIPGAEAIGQGELAQIKADAPIKAKAPQKDMDVGMFGSGVDQTDLLDLPAAKPKAEHPGLVIKSLQTGKETTIQPIGTKAPTLSDAEKAALREISADAQKLYQIAPPRGTPAGSEDARQAQRAEAIASFVRGINSGLSPDEAVAQAKAGIRDVIKRHNARSNDQHWGVDAGAYDAIIEHSGQRMKAAARAPAAQSEESTPDNADPLAAAFRDRLLQPDGKFRTIIEARKFAIDNGFQMQEGETNAKAIEEKIEFGLVLAARKIIADDLRAGKPAGETYDTLVALYERQPNLSARTSQSMAEQAYSTPLPLAFLASRLGRVADAGTVLEPTAGNGALLMETQPARQTVNANELNTARAAHLEAQGFKVTTEDAMEMEGLQVDAVIANPPFGAVREGGVSKTFEVGGHKTTAIDQAIMLRSLDLMKPKGRGVFIIGSVKDGTEATRSDGYNTSQKRKFFKRLYDNYNVVDHFTIAGELYGKQGAGWPVDVIVIEGKGGTNRKLPAAAVPPMFRSWDSLKGKIDEAASQGDNAGRPGNEDARPAGEAVRDPREGERRPKGGNSGSGAASGAARTVVGDAGTPRAGLRGDEPVAGERPGAGSDRPAVDAAGSGAERPRAPVDGDDSGRASSVDPFDAAFDAGQDEADGKAAPAPAAAAPKKPRAKREIAASAATNAVQSADAALSALSTLFNSKGRPGSGLSFDEETYAQAKPLFVTAASKFREFASDVSELVRRMVVDMRENYGLTRDGMEAMRPYMRRFTEEVQAGTVKLDAPVAAETSPATAPAPAPAPAKASTAKADASAGQIPYIPQSERGTRLNTLVPAGLGASMQASLDRIKADHGSIDDYVAGKLGYKVDELPKVFSAEQIDAIALAISNVDAGAGFIIGDQTGIGKGRVVAAAIRYAHKQGMVPVFVTEKPDLFGDMYRDLGDIQWSKALGRDPNIFMTNAGTQVAMDSEAVEWLSERDEAKERGEKVPERRGTFMQSQTATKSAAEMAKIIDGTSKPDVVFTTYDQMNSIKGAETDRRRFMDAIAPRAFIIMDEAHNAGGGAKNERASKGAILPRSAKFREWVQAAGAVMYSSATYAKNPQVMDLYSRTDMSKAVDDIEKLPDLIAKGGVPLQQVVASMLARAGQYARRERSFEGVAYDVETAPVDGDTYEAFAGSVRSIFEFDRGIAEFRGKWADAWLKENGAGLGMDSSIGEASASSVGFSSIMHNIVNQMVLSIKADTAAARAIQSLKDGEKPVIALSFTSESFISDYAEAAGIKQGDVIDVDFSDVLKRYLDRTLRVTFKLSDDTKKRVQIPLDELLPADRRAYNDAMAAINAADFSALPVSPLDHIRHRIEKAGYTVREITGRATMIDYATNTYVARPSDEQGATGKSVTKNKFNSGTLDVAILNRSGSTGISLHANAPFKDRRRRRMILLQADPNIDTHMQMLGRVHRTGQVIAPAYSQLTADIPAEARPTATLLKKMASLNANTTGARSSKFSADSAVDFMNEYGDEVAAQWAEDNWEANLALGEPVRFDENGRPQKDGAIQKLTGRLMLLNPAAQEELLETLSTSYASLLAQKNAMGENALEAKAMDLQARTVESRILKPATGRSPFEGAVSLDKVSVKSQGRAMKPADVIEAVSKSLGRPVTNSTFDVLDNLMQYGRTWRDKRIDTITGEFAKERDLIVGGLKDPEAKTRATNKQNEALKRWTSIMDYVYPGNRVVLEGDESIPAVVLKVEQKDGAKSKVAASGWLATFALPNSSRQITLPFSQLYTGTKPDDAPGLLVKPPAWTDSAKSLEGEFAQANVEGREDRFIVTGNLLAGYDTINGKGQIVQYTNDQGDVQPGILMPRAFTVEAFEKSRKVKFKTAEQALRYLDESKIGELQDADGIITIVKTQSRSYPYQIQMPKARATGGRFFTDASVRAVYDRWFAQGSKMMANVDRDGAARLITAFQNLKASFVTGEEQALADQIVGKVQYSAVAGAAPVTETPTKRPPLNDRQMKSIEAIIRRVAGDVRKIKFPDRIMAEGGAEAWGKATTFEAAGAYKANYMLGEFAGDMIEVSRRHGNRRVAYHESFHRLQELFLTNEERAVLARSTDGLKALVRQGAHKNDLDRMSQSELEAEAFAVFAVLRDANSLGKSGLHIAIRRAWDRMLRMMADIRAALTGEGITIERIFEDAQAGRIAQRPKDPMERQGGSREQFAPKPRRDPNATFATPGNGGRVTNFITQRISRKLAAALPSEINFRRKLQDRFIDVRNLQDAIKRAGGAIGEAYDVYMAESLYHGKVGERLNKLRLRTVDPIVEELKKRGITPDELDQFLYARHAPERNAELRKINPQIADPSGMSDAEAASIMAATGAKRADYDAVAAMVDGMISDSRQALLTSGLISQEMFDAWSNKYQFYVPLRGFETDEESGERPKSGKGFNVRGPESKRALGRESLADSPVLYAILQAEQAIIRAEKNRVGKAMLRLAKTHPNKEMYEVDKREPIRTVNKKTGLVEVNFMPPGFKIDDNVMVVKVGGKAHFITLHHEGLGRALTMLGHQNVGAIIAGMGRATRFLSAMSTRYNPEFVISNFARDMQTAFVHLSEQNKKGLQTAVLKDVGKAIRGSYGGLKGKDATAWQKWYQEYAEAGGPISFFDMRTIEDQRRSIEASLRAGKVRKTWEAVSNSIDTVNGAVENGIRLSTYANLRQRGLTKAQAASAARELTVNFNRRGEWGATMNALYMFSNAAMQGNVRMVQSLVRSKWTRRAALAIFAATMMSDWWNAWAGGDDDDDGMNKWDKVPAFEKERNFMLAFPGMDGFIKIPLPYGYNVFAVMGQQTGAVGRRVALGHKGTTPLSAAGHIMGSVAGAFSPIGTAPSVAQLVSPTLTDPIVQIASNETWNGNPIRPKRFDENKPEAYEHFKSAPAWAKNLAQSLNSMSGGNEFKAGWADTSPENMEHLVDFMFGGVGAFTNRTVKYLDSYRTGEEVDAHERPFVRTVVGSVGSSTNQGIFYDLRDDAIVMKRQIEGFAEAKDPAAMKAAREADPIMAKVYPHFIEAEKEMKKLRKQERAILATPDMAADRRKELTDRVKKLQEEAMTRARKVYERERRRAEE